LVDTIGAGGRAKEASRVRVKSALAKFMKLAPVLTSRGAALKVKLVCRECMAVKLGQ